MSIYRVMELVAELAVGAFVVGLLLAEGLDRIYRLYAELTGRQV